MTTFDRAGKHQTATPKARKHRCRQNCVPVRPTKSHRKNQKNSAFFSSLLAAKDADDFDMRGVDELIDRRDPRQAIT
ncbi:MAG: hypothetical protein ACREEM_52690, partial [Blastocatellia bacterium]